MSVLKGTISFYDYDGSDILAVNIQERLKYGLLELGAYTNISSSGTYGNLQRTASRVFEGVGAGWVWESGISGPAKVSGIYYNNTFYSIGTNVNQAGFNSSWYVDYRNGRVIFASGTPSGSSVKCNYTARDCAVYLADSREMRTIMTEFERRYSTMGSDQPSGMASYLKENKVHLPAVFINVSNSYGEGLQLGGGETQNYDVHFHIFSDRPFHAKRLSDLIKNQFQTTIDLYNPNSAPLAIRYDGSLSGSGIDYKYLGSRNSPYFWAYGRVDDANGGSFNSDLAEDLYRAECTWTVGVDRPIGTY